MRVITCPHCGSSAAIQIVRDPRETEAVGVSHWSARCEDCGSAWGIADEA